MHKTYTENGIRMMNTAGHYDLLTPGVGGTGRYVNVDIGSPLSDGSNGPISTVRFDLFGAAFNLLSIYAVDDSVGSSGSLTSSAGGVFNFPTSAGIHSFSGPDWTNLTWVDFSSPDGFIGLDNFTVQGVPEPSAMWLLLVGSLACFWLKFSNQ